MNWNLGILHQVKVFKTILNIEHFRTLPIQGFGSGLSKTVNWILYFCLISTDCTFNSYFFQRSLFILSET